MGLQSVTAKVDALREKGFSDTEINQLLGTTHQGEEAESISEASVLDALKKGNTQVLQQFSTGKDPEVFNEKVDELVSFMEKSSLTLFGLFLLGFIWLGSLIFFYTSLLDQYPFLATFPFIYMFLVLGLGNLYRYRYIKPRILYFIKK